MERFDYLNVARDLKNFYWEEFCDWYLEITKVRLYDENEKDKTTPKVVLFYVLENYLRMMHPIMPYITEAIWQSIPQSIREGPALIVAKYPKVNPKLIKEDKAESITKIMEIIREVRRIRTDFNVPASAKITLLMECGEKQKMFNQFKREIITLANLNPEKLEIGAIITPPKHAARIILHGVKSYIPFEGVIDVAAEKQRIEKQIKDVGILIERLKKKLDSPFATNAPADIVEEEREKLKEYELKQKQLREQAEILN